MGPGGSGFGYVPRNATRCGGVPRACVYAVLCCTHSEWGPSKTPIESLEERLQRDCGILILGMWRSNWRDEREEDEMGEIEHVGTYRSGQCP